MKKDKEDKAFCLFLLIVLAIIVIVTSSACNPEKRLSKLLKSHPELATSQIVVNVHHDTLMTKEIHKDSIITNIFSKDTVYIKEGKETVKYVYMTGNKAYISGNVAPDTIIKIDTVKSINRTLIKEVKAPKDGFEWLQFWLTMAVLAFVIGKYGGPFILKALRLIPHFPF